MVLDPRSTVRPHAGVKYVTGHYEDVELFSRTLSECEEWIDLAYATQPKTSFDDPLHDLAGNVPAAVALFRRALENDRLHRILFVSSGGTVYGAARDWPILETASTNPISPYGITKLTIEKYAFMFHQTRGLPALVVRPSNAYGPGQMPFTGQGFIATAIGCVLNRQPIPVYGGGGNVRDYLHVEDLARGILAVLDCGLPGEVYNLGSGVGRSNMQVLAALEPIARVHGYDIQTEHHPARGFDVPVNVLNCNKVTAATGWQPRVSFADGMEQTWLAIADILAQPSNQPRSI